ncbi:hypothetical protein M8J77_022651 [Diaphorina citri]|nr:hypothetical protein M8J77_022651 [Diaphorina citri]
MIVLEGDGSKNSVSHIGESHRNMLSGLVLAQKGVAALRQHKNSDKENVTTLICANAEGNVGPSYTLFKTGRFPSMVNNMVPRNWVFGKTEKGWMTAESFYLSLPSQDGR